MSASQQTVGGEVSLTRNERLDRLPFNKAHRKLLVASGIGWAFDAMDVGLVSFVVAAIAADPHFNLTPTEKSWVLSIGFVGMAIGAALGGGPRKPVTGQPLSRPERSPTGRCSRSRQALQSRVLRRHWVPRPAMTWRQ